MIVSAKPLVALTAKSFSDAIFFKETGEKVVALTIDDIPTNQDFDERSTYRILETITSHNRQYYTNSASQVSATFFVITDRLTQDTEIIKNILAQGHEIGNHGRLDRTHAQLPAREFEQEIEQAHQALAQGANAPIKWFRPGRALYNKTMTCALKKMAEREGYHPQFALASMLPLDTLGWAGVPNFTLKYLRQFIFPGAILLLHGGTVKRANNTVEVLKQLLPELRERGYSVTTLSELIFKH
jgi:peptidoglycan/xylan/chitin deacetylase (PgdA/CDA1 family)